MSTEREDSTLDKQPCVLVASEDEQFLSILREMLVRDAYNVRVGNNAQETLDLLLELVPDAVVVDAAMGNNAARRVLDTAGASFPQTPVLIATDEDTEEKVLRETAATAFDYLPKSCGAALLRYRVARAIPLQKGTTIASGQEGTDLEQDLQSRVRELSALYDICQEIGKEVPLTRTLRTVTRLLAEGMRYSSVVVAEIWLDGVRHSEFPELGENKVEITAPIRVGDKERGRLVVYACRNVRFEPSEVALVTNVARKTGYVIRRSELRRALYESQNKHRQLVEAIGEGIFWAELSSDGVTWGDGTDKESVIDRCMREMRVTDCNLGFASFYGCASVQDCIGTPISELCPTPEKARAYFEQILGHGRIHRRVIRSNDTGRRIRIEMLSHLVRQHERIVGIQGINIDSSDMIGWGASTSPQGPPVFEEEIKKLQLFSEVIECCECGVVLADANGTITYINPTQARLVGLAREDLIGANVTVFETAEQLQSRQEGDSAEPKPDTRSGQWLRRRTDDELIPVQIKASVISDDLGRPVAQLHLYYDLSDREDLRTKLEEQSENLRRIVEYRTRELMRSEEAYRFLYQNAPVGTAITSLTGMVVDVNPATCFLLKYNRDELIKKNMAFLFCDSQQYHSLMTRLSAGEEVLDEEIEYQAKDGHRVTIQQSSILIESAANDTLITHFLKDITQAKQSAEEAEASRQQMARADRLASLGQLVAGVAHELNNPLTAVLTYAHLLRKKNADTEEVKRQLDLIVEAGERCRRIVRDLLDFARDKAPTMVSTNLNEIVRRVLGMVDNQTIIQKITVVTRLQDDLPVIRVDQHQFEQVIVNICMNAIEAMPDGGTLTVASRDDPEGNYVVFTVEDTGVGVPQENLERVFDPFFTTKTAGKGTGLGLAVSQRIINSYGGHIQVASEAGEGSAFTIEIPVQTHTGESREEDEESGKNSDR